LPTRQLRQGPAATSAAVSATPARSTPAAATPQAAAAAASSNESAAASATAAKTPLDYAVRHFLAEGFKPEMHHGEEIYCRKETTLGSRLSQQKTCGTIEALKLMEKSSQTGVADTQRKQVGISTH